MLALVFVVINSLKESDSAPILKWNVYQEGFSDSRTKANLWPFCRAEKRCVGFERKSGAHRWDSDYSVTYTLRE